MKTNHAPAKKLNKNKYNTLGPLDDLENHVNPEWWRYLFNSLYIKTDGDVVEDDEITRNEVDMFEGILNVEKEATILDVCCGQGRHTFEFFKRGYINIEGLDRSSYLITKARQKSKASYFPIKFREGDARKLPYEENSFEAVMILGNSFGYFECQDDDLQVLLSAAKVLKPGGKLLIDVADGDFLKRHFKPRSWEWINKKQFVCRERCLSSSGKKLISREVITQTDKGVIADQFYAENLYTSEDLETLLRLSGFENIIMSPALEVKSHRNQDLGMMENRIIMSATI